MHNGDQLLTAAIAGAAELDLIRDRMRTTISHLDTLIAQKRRAHLSLVTMSSPDVSVGRKVADVG